MGFLSPSVSMTRFRILDEVPNEVYTNIRDILTQFAFRDIDEVSVASAHGWTGFNDILNTEWQTVSPQVGNLLAFSFRRDMRRIPESVFKKHFAVALMREQERNSAAGRSFISRERKKEIKELVLVRLREKFLPVPASYQVLWNTTNNEIWLSTAVDSVIDLFMTYFMQSFGLRLEQVTPLAEANHIFQGNDTLLERVNRVRETIFSDTIREQAEQSPNSDTILGEEFLTWLWYKSMTSNTGERAELTDKITLSNSNKDITSVKSENLGFLEAVYSVQMGKKICKARLNITDNPYEHTVSVDAASFAIRGLKTPKVDLSDSDDSEEALILEKFFLIDNCMQTLMGLYKQFLELRVSDDWAEEARTLIAWFAQEAAEEYA